MKCYRCGRELSGTEHCTACGADVTPSFRLYKLSARYYNDALEKARVRDLSGAVSSLHHCLSLDKENIDARNLLGLIYYEVGDVTEALAEWIISTYLRQNKNIASEYIERVQENEGRRHLMNQSIKEYNIALNQCMQDNEDMAIISLKKIVARSPKFLKAGQLLGLLYLSKEEWADARNVLEKCLKIDVNNTMTLRFLKEAESMQDYEQDEPERGGGFGRKKRGNNEAIRYVIDNETIIKPPDGGFESSRGHGGFFYLVIGLAIGIAAAYFLIMPARLQTARQKSDEDYKSVSEQLDARTATVADLEQQLSAMQRQMDGVKDELENITGSGGTMQTVDYLIAAAAGYINNPEDREAVGHYLELIFSEVDIAGTSDSFRELYNTLIRAVGPELSRSYYEEGNNAYRDGNYFDAVMTLEKAVKFDAANTQAMLVLGNAYYRSGELDNASSMFNRIIEEFPDTEAASMAQAALTDMNPEG